MFKGQITLLNLLSFAIVNFIFFTTSIQIKIKLVRVKLLYGTEVWGTEVHLCRD